MSLLSKLEHRRLLAREALRLQTRLDLQRVLSDLLPRQTVIVFGSLTRPGKFHARSDIDVALLEPVPAMSEYRLQALLEESLHRSIDLVVLNGVRFREKIEREGERWELSQLAPLSSSQ